MLINTKYQYSENSNLLNTDVAHKIIRKKKLEKKKHQNRKCIEYQSLTKI